MHGFGNWRDILDDNRFGPAVRVFFVINVLCKCRWCCLANKSYQYQSQGSLQNTGKEGPAIVVFVRVIVSLRLTLVSTA